MTTFYHVFRLSIRCSVLQALVYYKALHQLEAVKKFFSPTEDDLNSKKRRLVCLKHISNSFMLVPYYFVTTKQFTTSSSVIRLEIRSLVRASEDCNFIWHFAVFGRQTNKKQPNVFCAVRGSDFLQDRNANFDITNIEMRQKLYEHICSSRIPILFWCYNLQLVQLLLQNRFPSYIYLCGVTVVAEKHTSTSLNRSPAIARIWQNVINRANWDTTNQIPYRSSHVTALIPKSVLFFKLRPPRWGVSSTWDAITVGFQKHSTQV